MLKTRLNSLHNKALKGIKQALKDNNKALVVLPTGTGKTRVAAKAIKQWLKNNDKKVVFITHKIDLKKDAVDELKQMMPKRTVGIFTDIGVLSANDIVVATIQTISKLKHLDAINPDEIGLIVVDEGHHSPASQYQRFLEKCPNAARIGLTATYLRPDGMSISDIFGAPCIEMSIAEAIKRKIYADPNNLSRVILTDATINGKADEDGEYSASELERAVVNEERNAVVLASYKEFVKESSKKKIKAIGFAVNVAHARRMAEYFSANGIPSSYVVGDYKVQPTKDRFAAYKTFKETDGIEVLWSVDLLNEGSNFPDVNCLLMVRPTRSNIIYTQQLGRGSRFLDDKKEEVCVLDFVDNTRKGFQTYTKGNVTGAAYKGNQVVTKYVKHQDPVVINERVNAITAVNAYEIARQGLYATKEEAYEACRKLKIAKHAEYKLRYKEDPKLPSNPDRTYQEWSYTDLSGRIYHKGINNFYADVADAYEACRALGIASLEDYRKRYKEHPRLPSTPYKAYKNWSFSVLLGRPSRHRGEVLNKTTGEVYKNAAAATLALGIVHRTLRRAILRGHRAGGFHWEYVKKK